MTRNKREIKRRTYLYLVAAGVGAAVGISEIAETGPNDVLPIGGGGGGGGNGDDDGSVSGVTASSGTGGAGGSTSSFGDFSVSVASSLSAIPDPDIKPNITVVTDNRGWGIHLDYDANKPIHAEAADGTFGISIADTLDDVPEPQRSPWFIFIDGQSRDHGIHIHENGETGIFDSGDIEFALEPSIADVAASESEIQVGFITGDDRTRGVHIDG